MFKKCLSVPFSLGLVVLVLCSVFGSFVVLPVRAEGYSTENVFNGGCEMGYTGWQTTMGNNEQSMLEAHGGNRSFLDSDDDGFFGHDFYQEFDPDVLSDDVGYLSFWVKTSGAVMVNVYLYYELAGPVSEYLGDPITYADWTLVNSSLTSQYPGDYVTHVFISVSCLTAGNKVYLDDISLSSDYYADSPPAEEEVDLFTGLARLLVPLTVICIPVLFFVVVCKMGSWGAVIGLAIGVGLAYVFLPVPYQIPLWVVFLVAVGEFGMIYKGRGGG